jgi:hypothetical protein
MTQFVILAAPRTGSNLLCTLLNSHPDILCHHEVFNPQGIFVALTHRDRPLDLGSPQQRDRDPLGFLDRVWESGRTYASVGFKWTRGQNEQVLTSVLADHAVKKIVLRRGNRVKTFVSEKIAHSIDQWEVYCEQQLVTRRPRVCVEPAELRSHIALNEQFYDDLCSSLIRTAQPHLELEYEALFSPHEQTRLLRFLEVDPGRGSLKAASVKQNSTDLRDLVANFDQLARCLAGSELEAELHDRSL